MLTFMPPVPPNVPSGQLFSSKPLKCLVVRVGMDQKFPSASPPLTKQATLGDVLIENPPVAAIKPAWASIPTGHMSHLELPDWLIARVPERAIPSPQQEIVGYMRSNCTSA